jgi:hypothetical protein
MLAERLVHAMKQIVAAFLNKSTLVSDSDCLKWAIACAKQAREHAAPVWGWPTPQLIFLPDESFATPSMDLIYVFDDSDTAGALGYHDSTPAGQPYAKIFARTCIENGISVSSCLSHEVLELCGDPGCDQYAAAGDGFEYAQELCDAVEAFTYDMDGVEMSDFVTPNFFAQDGLAPFDYLGKLTKPFETGAGGYQIRMNPKTGQVGQVYGDARADWRNSGKEHPAARTARRMRK